MPDGGLDFDGATMQANDLTDNVQPDPAAGELWSITVHDNGIGIDPRYAEKVFAIFSRLHAREQYEGTGIGLALCRKIVEFHGGTIRAVFNENATENTTTTGATLCFTLPVSVGAIVPAALSTTGDS